MNTRALFLLLPLAINGCAEIGDADDSLTETDSELSAFDWSGTGIYGVTANGGQVATLGGVTYMVHTGENDKNMYWRKRAGNNTWTASYAIPGQKTSLQPSLAAFNGYLYMVHVGESDQSAVWFSRFDPATETWTPNVKLSFTTDSGAPALAAFDGRLWMVGATEVADGLDWLWVATMNTSETFSAQTTIRKATSSRASLASFANKLYLAYSSGGNLYTMTHGIGGAITTWSAPAPVRPPSGTTSQGYDPSIAVAGGYLHLVHRRPDGSTTWWTYWDQCKWAPEIQFDQQTSDHSLSLTTGGPGLVLLRDQAYAINGVTSYYLKATEYYAPPPPMSVPQCLGAM